LKGRYILESVVVAHEVIHATHSSDDGGLVLKLNYEKSYDRASWEFLHSILLPGVLVLFLGIGFPAFLNGGSFHVRIHDCNNPYFVAGKGLKQGDPLSPILYNFAADVFSKMLFRAGRYD
jgi:hypothetical protein